ncbi:enoyl reductase [Whalleya microplaca]|nr:enoyl reductase [Whalleya microplaca]
MDSLPNSQRALKARGPKQVEIHEECSLPVLEADEILVRVRCVGINPVDVKMLDMAPHVGATIGCEFAGDIVKVGTSVKNSQLKVGVAVFGCVCGNNPNRPDNGAFADYVAVAGGLVYLLPPHLSYQHGATLGAALPTVGMALYQKWHLAPPLPPSAIGTPENPEVNRYVLVYGGSTACGAMALQMIRKSGLVPALGAQEAFDYHSPSCGDDIRCYTADALAYVFDCITDISSMRICYAAMGRAGGKYMGLNPIPVRAHTRRDIKPDYILVYTMFGKEVSWPRPFARPARRKDRAFAESWYQATQTLVDTPGEIHPHPLEQGPDNLQGVIKGLDRMRKGDVSGVKLVYDLI